MLMTCCWTIVVCLAAAPAKDCGTRRGVVLPWSWRPSIRWYFVLWTRPVLKRRSCWVPLLVYISAAEGLCDYFLNVLRWIYLHRLRELGDRWHCFCNYSIGRTLLQSKMYYLWIGRELPRLNSRLSSWRPDGRVRTMHCVENGLCRLVRAELEQSHGCALVNTICIAGELKSL